MQEAQFIHLFGSKTRVKLLSLFYNNPERPYYVREITRIIDEQINSVRRELQNLLSIGIVRSVGQGNRLYYELNPDFDYLTEFISIFKKIPARSRELKDTKEEDQILKRLMRTGNIQLAFLTGAFVRGSDVKLDLFLVGDINKAKLSEVIHDLEKVMNRELNFTCMSADDFSYRRSVNDRFLLDLLDVKKNILIDRLSVFNQV